MNPSRTETIIFGKFTDAKVSRFSFLLSSRSFFIFQYFLFHFLKLNINIVNSGHISNTVFLPFFGSSFSLNSTQASLRNSCKILKDDRCDIYVVKCIPDAK